ncbi:CRM1 C terminal-domain-containing protein [Suillus subluteus]|nr:CRM1 C terminal-domain-containing protein [Suillus subluteus]
MAGLVQAGYLTSSMRCIASLSGLGSQATARQGNALGILGVRLGILSSLLAVGFPPALLARFAGVATIGGTIGTIIDRHIMATELPQMVAALHSVVGLAAVLTSIGSVLADPSHLSMLHLVTAYLGVVIGGYPPTCPLQMTHGNFDFWDPRHLHSYGGGSFDGSGASGGLKDLGYIAGAMFVAGSDTELVLNLTLFLSNFLSTHLRAVETKVNCDILLNAHLYMVQVDEHEIFKITLEYWSKLVAEFYDEIQALPISESGLLMGLSLGSSGRNMLNSMSLRKNTYSNALSNPRPVVIEQMVKPEEVVVKMNVSACTSIGSLYLPQVGWVFLDMLGLYKMVSGIISETVAREGNVAIKTPKIRQLRTAKKEILKLMETYIKKAEDLEAVNTNFMPPLLDAILGDYNRNVPTA